MREETTNTSGQGRHLRPPHFVSTLSAVLLVFTGLLSPRSYAATTDFCHEGRSLGRGITPFVQDTLREAEGLTFTFDADVPAASEATEEATAPTATPAAVALLPIADSTSGNGSAPLPGLDLESAFDAAAPLAADTLTNAATPETFQPELLGDLTALPEPSDPAPDAGSIAPSDPAPAGSSQLSITDATYRQVIREGAQSLSCHLTYPQGRAAVLPDFEGNASELRRLDDFVRQVYRDSLIYVNSIRLCGYCSIEGSYSLNERLARSRVEGFRQYLDEKYGLSAHYTVNVDWVPEDWATLREMVDTSRMENRRDVVFLIDHMDIFEGREKKLMDLRGGVPYKYMLKHLFPALRRVEIVVEYDLRRIMEEKLQRKLDEEEFAAALEAERRAAEAEERRLEAERQAAEQARLEAERRAAEQARLEAERQAAEAARLEAERRAAEAARLEAERQAAEAARLEAERRAALRTERRESRKLRPLFALKTDLVAWSGLRPDFRMRTFMPNLEGELYFAERWSVSATGLYANWSYDGGREFWGLSSYSVEPRFWIRRDGLFRGLFVGLYGEVGDFNNQQGRVDGQTTLDNYTGTYWSAGLAAGYLVPLSRHWSVELALRGGYRSVDYDRYDRELPYLYYSGSGTQRKFALTGLRLSIVYRFGRVGQ